MLGWAVVEADMIWPGWCDCQCNCGSPGALVPYLFISLLSSFASVLSHSTCWFMVLWLMRWKHCYMKKFCCCGIIGRLKAGLGAGERSRLWQRIR